MRNPLGAGPVHWEARTRLELGITVKVVNPHPLPSRDRLEPYPLWLAKVSQATGREYVHAVTHLGNPTQDLAVICYYDGMASWQIALIALDGKDPNVLNIQHQIGAWTFDTYDAWQQRWNLIRDKLREVLTEVVL